MLGLQKKMTGCEILSLDCAEEDLGPGDVIHLETPVNPTGEACWIEGYARKAHARGAFLLVDATFGPPGLQDPFVWGADVVMHAGTKYLGGRELSFPIHYSPLHDIWGAGRAFPPPETCLMTPESSLEEEY